MSDAQDAARYRWLKAKLEGSLSGGIEVNDAKLSYETPIEGEEVRLYWYPYTPVGFLQINASTLDDAIDQGMASWE